MWIVLAVRGAAVGTGSGDALRYRIVETSTHPAPWTVTDHLLEVP